MDRQLLQILTARRLGRRQLAAIATRAAIGVDDILRVRHVRQGLFGRLTRITLTRGGSIVIGKPVAGIPSVKKAPVQKHRRFLSRCRVSILQRSHMIWLRPF